MSWKRLTTKTVFENPWISVHEERVINPAGGENNYGRVHFKNQAVAIVPIDDDGNTWLVGQHRYTLNEYSWEVPMGGSPEGEDPLETARRELKEETGLSATEFEQVLRVHISNSVTDEVGFVFIARGLSEGETDFDDSEVLEIRKLPLDEAIQMALDGRITCESSVASLLRVALER